LGGKNAPVETTAEEEEECLLVDEPPPSSDVVFKAGGEWNGFMGQDETIKVAKTPNSFLFSMTCLGHSTVLVPYSLGPSTNRYVFDSKEASTHVHVSLLAPDFKPYFVACLEGHTKLLNATIEGKEGKIGSSELPVKPGGIERFRN